MWERSSFVQDLLKKQPLMTDKLMAAVEEG
jgi:hypothetical protein